MIRLMDRSMGLAARRQGLIAANLANLDTPGYRTQDFAFETALRATLDGQNAPTVLRRTHAAHLRAAPEDPEPEALEVQNAASADGNDVSLDRESLLLSQTQTTYQTAASFMQVELRKLYGLLREAGAH